MSLCKLAWLAGAFVLFTARANAAEWVPVPGAPEILLDVSSIEQVRSRVVAWLRWQGTGPLTAVPATPGAGTPKPYRTAVHAEFDCSGSTVRTLQGTGYDSGGAVLFIASIPGPVLPVTGNDLGWTFDAVCEAARSGA